MKIHVQFTAVAFTVGFTYARRHAAARIPKPILLGNARSLPAHPFEIAGQSLALKAVIVPRHIRIVRAKPRPRRCLVADAVLG